VASDTRRKIAALFDGAEPRMSYRVLPRFGEDD
jgi:hypothetical protein